MFWDGDRWVDERAPKYRAARRTVAAARQRFVDVLATGIIVVALLALGIPLTGASAGTPVVRLSPSAGPAGSLVAVTVENLGNRTRAQLTWDGTPIRNARYAASRDGSFAAQIRIPSTTVGPHVIGVTPERRTTRRTRASFGPTMLATATFTVGALVSPNASIAVGGAAANPGAGGGNGGGNGGAVVTPGATPTLDPTAGPTLGPTPSPTLGPTPSPEPPDPTQPPPDPTRRPDPTPRPPDPTPKPPDPTPKPPPPDPDPPNGVTGIYGSAFGMDSKNNLYIGGGANQKVSHRFRAGTDGKLKTIAFNQRGGPGYSGGNGGSIEITIQTNDGGKPSGNVLATLTFNPGNPGGHWENHERLTFPNPPDLNAGQIYHVVFRNVAGSPGSNFISANEAYQYKITDPRQPMWGDGEFAVMVNTGGGWNVSEHDTAVMDLGYTNGHHDGNAYYEMTPEYFTEISGAKMARERFKVSGSTRVVTEAWIRIKRHHGNSPLTVRLEASDGTVLASDTIAASQIPTSPLWTPGGTDYTEASLAGSKWVKANFGEAIQLKSGQGYRLRFSTESDTLYAALPVRELTDQVVWDSRAFRDGEAERTFGNGWNPVYQWGELDLQFYLY